MREQLGSHVGLVGALLLLAFDQFAVVVPQVSDDLVAREAPDWDYHSFINPSNGFIRRRRLAEAKTPTTSKDVRVLPEGTSDRPTP